MERSRFGRTQLSHLREVDDLVRHPGLLQSSRPLSDLVVLSREVEDLPTLARDLDNGVDDLPSSAVVTRAQRFIEKQGKLSRLVLLEERQAHRDQKLDALTDREVLDGLSGPRPGAGSKHRRTRVVVQLEQQLSTSQLDQEFSGAVEHLRPGTLDRDGSHPLRQQSSGDGRPVLLPTLFQCTLCGITVRQEIGQLVAVLRPLHGAFDLGDPLAQRVSLVCDRVLLIDLLVDFERIEG